MNSLCIAEGLLVNCCLFQASTLPMSIIIVGVGDADFTGNMIFVFPILTKYSLNHDNFVCEIYKCVKSVNCLH